MKKLILILSFLILNINAGFCSPISNEINIYNLKEKNIYLLDLDSSVKEINISDESLLNITPVTSITNDRKQLFIEAEKDGVCDVQITTESKEYRLRFITGPVFQDNKDNLTQIDLPGMLIKGQN